MIHQIYDILFEDQVMMPSLCRRVVVGHLFLRFRSYPIIDADPGHFQMQITHCSEVDVKMFNTDMNMNMWDAAVNAVEPISCRGENNSTVFL
jgi:hypothetical protein